MFFIINLVFTFIIKIRFPKEVSIATPSIGPEHTGHFVQPHVAAHCGGPEHTRARCGGHMNVMYANALSVAGTSHSLWHT